MRTTLTLDPDVSERIRQEMAHGKVSLKEVVNRSLRMGLNLEKFSQSNAPFEVKPHSSGYRHGIDPLKLNQLADDLESEAFLQQQINQKR